MRATVLLLPLLVLAALPATGSAPPPATVSIHEDFGPGEWIVVYAYVPAGTTSVSFIGSLDMRAASPLGQPVALFAMPPTLMVDRSGAQDLVGVFDTPLVQTQAWGGALERHESPDAVVATSGIFGVQMGFAASHAWRLDLDITIPQATFAVVYRYGGAIFASAAQVTIPAFGVQEFEFQVPNRGWTHLSTEATNLQPVGVRTYQVQFPNGFSYVGTGQVTGANAVVAGVSNGNNYWGGFGATSDVAGRLHARLMYAEASLGAPLAVVHLPWPDQNGLYSMNYKTFDGGLDVELPS